jgi:hypothetical protein
LKRHNYVSLLLFVALLFGGQGCKTHPPEPGNESAIKRIELNLSAMGVEADSFPNITALIDLQNDSSYCDVSYYDPKFKATAYRLTNGSMDSVRWLMAQFNVKRLKPRYEVSSTDLPTSTAIFYFTDTTIQIVDYGLEGPSPLKELYRIVYRRK